MVSDGKGRLFKRTDGKYLIYVPVYLAQDSMFPFHITGEGKRGRQTGSIEVKISFKPGGKKELLIQEWTEPAEEESD